MSDQRNAAIEAIADAWASIDGRMGSFRAGKGKPRSDAAGGHYDGYILDATSMMERLEQRGYTVTPIAKE